MVRHPIPQNTHLMHTWIAVMIFLFILILQPQKINWSSIWSAQFQSNR